ncbi:hypothetical protein ACQ4M3_37185 [Leptolyngbya sp. AN03gr2]|uniref:hypothetical protein n=1 Tax=unclassified Leptolyngbya TaxID=2650499 RepID=UPI003D316280
MTLSQEQAYLMQAASKFTQIPTPVSREEITQLLTIAGIEVDPQRTEFDQEINQAHLKRLQDFSDTLSDVVAKIKTAQRLGLATSIKFERLR